MSEYNWEGRKSKKKKEKKKKEGLLCPFSAQSVIANSEQPSLFSEELSCPTDESQPLSMAAAAPQPVAEILALSIPWSAVPQEWTQLAFPSWREKHNLWAHIYKQVCQITKTSSVGFFTSSFSIEGAQPGSNVGYLLGPKPINQLVCKHLQRCKHAVSVQLQKFKANTKMSHIFIWE